MGRKSPTESYSRKAESYRPGSVTSSDLSDVSSLGKKSSAPKIVAVIIVSLAIVAILVGVTVYLIDAEKAKQKVEREERIEEGLETEIDFGENAKAYIAEERGDTIDTTEKLLDLSGKSDFYESLSRKLTKEQVEQLKQISQRRRFLENFHKSKQEEFLRPTAEEKEIISSLISARKPNIAAIAGQGARGKPPGQDLEFGGVGLFGNNGNRHQQQHQHQDSDHEDEDRDRAAEVAEAERLLALMKYREDADPAHEDIYDMSSYIAQGTERPPPAPAPHPRQPRPGQGPRRHLRPRNKLLRLGLEGFRRNEPVELQLEPAEDAELPPAAAAVLPAAEAEERLGVSSSGGGAGPGLATIDRRPGRPTFHHQGPLGLRPFGRRRFRHGPRQEPAGGHGAKQGHGADQMATETMLQRKMLVEMSNNKQDEILSNFDSFLKIAGSELGFLRNVAKNITQSGKEVNLWEVLSAVNETVRKNPDSSIAQLMTKFEVS